MKININDDVKVDARQFVFWDDEDEKPDMKKVNKLIKKYQEKGYALIKQETRSNVIDNGGDPVVAVTIVMWFKKALK